MINRTTSQPSRASRTSTIILRPRELSGLCTPGVSIKTICAALRPLALGRLTMPWIRLRVVCGLGEMIASFSPTRALSNVDLPALGRPRMQTKPERKGIGIGRQTSDLDQQQQD